MDDQYYTPEPQVVNAPSNTQVMVFGIVALALAELGLPGLILAIIARKKAKAWTAAYGPFVGKAKVGNILSRVALPVSIVMMVFWILYIVGMIVGSTLIFWAILHTNDLPQNIDLSSLPELAAFLTA